MDDRIEVLTRVIAELRAELDAVRAEVAWGGSGSAEWLDEHHPRWEVYRCGLGKWAAVAASIDKAIVDDYPNNRVAREALARSLGWPGPATVARGMAAIETAGAAAKSCESCLEYASDKMCGAGVVLDCGAEHGWRYWRGRKPAEPVRLEPPSEQASNRTGGPIVNGTDGERATIVFDGRRLEGVQAIEYSWSSERGARVVCKASVTMRARFFVEQPTHQLYVHVIRERADGSVRIDTLKDCRNFGLPRPTQDGMVVVDFTPLAILYDGRQS